MKITNFRELLQRYKDGQCCFEGVCTVDELVQLLNLLAATNQHESVDRSLFDLLLHPLQEDFIDTHKFDQLYQAINFRIGYRQGSACFACQNKKTLVVG